MVKPSVKRWIPTLSQLQVTAFRSSELKEMLQEVLTVSSWSNRQTMARKIRKSLNQWRFMMVYGWEVAKIFCEKMSGWLVSNRKWGLGTGQNYRFLTKRYPPTPAAQGGARKGKGFSDTTTTTIFWHNYYYNYYFLTQLLLQHQQQAAGRRRQQQAAAGISRQQQTQADAAAVSATAAVQQLAARKIVFF